MRNAPTVFGLALLGALCSASAAIVSTTIADPPLIHYDLLNQFQEIDLNGDGIVDFSLQTEPLGTGFSAPGQSAVFGIQDPPPDDIGVYVAALNGGELIGPNLPQLYGPDAGFYRDETEGGYHLLAGAFSSENGFVTIGNFVLKRAYAGVRFQINGETHYGWVDLENVFIGNGAAFKVHGWAYDTVADQPIAAGAVPEPRTGLMMLAGVIAYLSRNRGERRSEGRRRSCHSAGCFTIAAP